MFQLQRFRNRNSGARDQHERGRQPRGRHNWSISSLRAGPIPEQQVYYIIVELNDKTACFSDDLDNDIEDIIQEFEGKCEREVLHTVLFY